MNRSINVMAMEHVCHLQSKISLRISNMLDSFSTHSVSPKVNKISDAFFGTKMIVDNALVMQDGELQATFPTTKLRIVR